MTFVDATALINDLEYCTKDKICLIEPDLIQLQKWANDPTIPRFRRAAANAVGKWLCNHPDSCCFWQTGLPIDHYLTGDPFRVLLDSDELPFEYVGENTAKQDYTGWRKVYDEKFAAALCDGTATNWYDFATNEYAVVNHMAFRFTGEKFVPAKARRFKSEAIGVIEPKDVYQSCAFDSLLNNDITVLYGMAGSGKTLLPLAFALQELEANRIRRIHFIYHYEKLKNARELGFVKGDQTEKLLKSGSLGNILASKLGGMDAVERLLRDGAINIMPTSSIRGFEAGGDEMIFCTEAQDLDPYTVKTIIQRAKAGCKICLEGDADEQTDISRTSGLGKVIDVFKGQPCFGCVKLVNDYRSGYGKLADLIH